jgi:hypothetical protein
MKRSDHEVRTGRHTMLQKLAGRDTVEVLERVQNDLVLFAAQLMALRYMHGITLGLSARPLGVGRYGGSRANTDNGLCMTVLRV